MSDSKYGRLFTEQDVKDILSQITLEQIGRDSVDSVLDEYTDTTFPPDEPLFVLRAQSCPTGVLVAYGNEATASGATDEHVHGVQDTINAFVLWQREHGRKVPD